MRILPDNLATMVSPEKWERTANPLILKPTFGTVGSQFASFDIINEYSAVETEKQGKEIKIPVEVCHIQNDKFTRAAIRVKDLSQKQKIDLAPIYERFKTQKDSTDTQIVNWEAVTDMEKNHLVHAGIYSVEQLEGYTDEQLYKLGPSGQEWRDKARKHAAAKKPKDNSLSEELSLLRKEKEEMASRLKSLEEKMFAKLASKEVKKKGGRPRKTVEQINKEDEAA